MKDVWITSGFVNILLTYDTKPSIYEQTNEMNFLPPNNQVSFIITIKGEKVLSQHSISIHVEDEEKDTHHEVALNAMLHKMIDINNPF